jgi:hypothetical protein
MEARYEAKNALEMAKKGIASAITSIARRQQRHNLDTLAKYVHVSVGVNVSQL